MKWRWWWWQRLHDIDERSTSYWPIFAERWPSIIFTELWERLSVFACVYYVCVFARTSLSSSMSMKIEPRRLSRKSLSLCFYSHYHMIKIFKYIFVYRKDDWLGSMFNFCKTRCVNTYVLEVVHCVGLKIVLFFQDQKNQLNLTYHSPCF